MQEHEVVLLEIGPVAAGDVELRSGGVFALVEEGENGIRRAMRGGDAFDDRFRSGYAVAGGENVVRSRAEQSLSADFDVASFRGGEAGGSDGALADCGNHGIGFDFEVGARNRFGFAASGSVGFAERHLLADEREFAVILLVETDRSGEKLELRAFFDRFFDFDCLSGHFLLRSAVDDGRFSAEADGGAGAVHRGVAAADDQGFARVLAVLPVLVRDRAEPVDAHFGEFVAFDAHGACLPGTDCDDYGVVAFLEFIEGEVLPEFASAFPGDAHLLEVFEFAAEGVFGETEFGDAVTEHSARFRLLVEHGDGNSGETQVVRCGESGGSCADDGDLLAVQRGKLFHVGVVVQIGGETLEVVDGDGRAEDVLAAVFLAEARADASDGHRQGNALLDDLQGFKEVALASFADIFLDGSVCGTRHGAWSFAVAGVLGEKQVQRGAAHVLNLFGGGVDLLSLARAGRAGGEEASGFEILDHADETGCRAGDLLIVTQGRNIQTHSSGYGENGLSGRRGLRLAVYDEVDVRHCKYSVHLLLELKPSPRGTRLMAFFGHISRQELHLRHLALSMTKSLVMVAAGQFLMQSLHLTHLL